MQDKDFIEEAEFISKEGGINDKEGAQERGSKAIIADYSEASAADADIENTIITDTPIVVPAGKDKAIVVRDVSLAFFGKSVVSTKEKAAYMRELSKAAPTKEEKESTILAIDSTTGAVYNRLTVFDKKFIIALQILLSDLTKNRRKVLEAANKVNRASSEEIPDLFKGIEIDDLPRPVSDRMKAAGFSKEDIIVIIPGKDFFLKAYLGYKTIGGKDRANFSKSLHKLRTGLFAWLGENKPDVQKGQNFNSTIVGLIQKYQSFNYRSSKNKEVQYYVFSLSPLLTKGIGRNYKYIPQNNAEIFNAIGDNEALFALYDYILIEASHNFDAPEERGATHVWNTSEDYIFTSIFCKDTKEVNKHRKRLRDILYKGLSMFYNLGVLTEEVLPPTEEARKRGKDIPLTIHIRRFSYIG